MATPPTRARAGFTLVELAIAAGLSGLLLAVCLSLSLYTARSIASMTDSVDLNARSRYAIDRMSQKLRQATVVKSISTNSVSVISDGRTLTYTYTPSLKTLFENDDGMVTALVEDCQNLKFTLYKRNAVTNAFNQFPQLTTTNGAKVIQVNWECRRSLLGEQSGSGEMVGARIVLRAK
jgi:Tfp pilus assembly protein PilW